MNDQDRKNILERYTNSSMTPLQVVTEYQAEQNSKRLNQDIAHFKSLVFCIAIVLFIILAIAILMIARM